MAGEGMKREVEYSCGRPCAHLMRQCPRQKKQKGTAEALRFQGSRNCREDNEPGMSL